jgi:ketol-acid reductoisomerase
VTETTKQEMKKMLEDIRSGAYARGWIAENAAGRPWFNEQRRAEAALAIEEVGARLRSMMPFLKPVTIQQSEPLATSR